MLSIRSATANDVPLLITFFQEFAAFERVSTVITEEQLRQDGFAARPKFQVLIAELDGLPAGYALFFDCYSSLRGHAIFLEDLFVRQAFRGKGVGRALLAHVARMTEGAQGFSILFNVLDWNTRAIEFYRRIGATFLDDWKTVCLQQKALHDLASAV
ncbi:MAG TPA: GNAT family N-acetyltransferase [Candidatus Acidoferrum sp.]|nr:GNAT family N-acetyltransferase [Candidatus Acidoferrum sp.]